MLGHLSTQVKGGSRTDCIVLGLGLGLGLRHLAPPDATGECFIREAPPHVPIQIFKQLMEV